MNTRRTTLLIAIILALGTGWLTLSYISSLQRANQPTGAPQQVLIAAQDIPARATITQQMFTIETRNQSVVQPGALSDPTKAVGSVALITIPSGSQITQADVGTTAQAALPVRLQPGMRAVSIPIDKVKGVSGLVQPGDRVDVIAIPPRQGGQQPVAVTILRGIRVLAIGATLENASATPSPDEQNATTATLEVNPKQADLLAMADVNTTLRLALRSPEEPIRSEETETLVFAGGGSTQPQPAAPPVGAAVGAAMQPQPVPVPKPDSAAQGQWPSNVQLIVGDQLLAPGKSQ
jgi:pilus assembly protein CpaB